MASDVFLHRLYVVFNMVGRRLFVSRPSVRRGARSTRATAGRRAGSTRRDARATRSRRDGGRARGRDDDDAMTTMTTMMTMMTTHLTKTTTRARHRAGRGTRARRGATSASTREDVRDIANDIATATPTSRAHSLADCAYSTATTSATMRLRDRVVCALAATAIEAVVASGMDPAEGGFGRRGRGFSRRGEFVDFARARGGDEEERRSARGASARGVRAVRDDGGRERGDGARVVGDRGQGARRVLAGDDFVRSGATERRGLRRSRRDDGAVRCRGFTRGGVRAGDEGAADATPSAHRAQRRRAPGRLARRSREKTKPGHGLTLKPPPAGVRGAANAQKRVEFFQSQVLAAGVLGTRKVQRRGAAGGARRVRTRRRRARRNRALERGQARARDRPCSPLNLNSRIVVSTSRFRRVSSPIERRLDARAASARRRRRRRAGSVTPRRAPRSRAVARARRCRRTGRRRRRRRRRRRSTGDATRR